MFEALDLGVRHTIRHRFLPYLNRVIHPKNGLECVAHGKQVHLRAQATELDYLIPFGLVFEIAHFSGVKISMATSEVRKVAITNLAKVDGISEMGGARLSLLPNLPRRSEGRTSRCRCKVFGLAHLRRFSEARIMNTCIKIKILILFKSNKGR